MRKGIGATGESSCASGSLIRLISSPAVECKLNVHSILFTACVGPNVMQTSLSEQFGAVITTDPGNNQVFPLIYLSL